MIDGAMINGVISFDVILVALCSFLGAGVGAVASSIAQYKIEKARDLTEKKRKVASKMLEQLELYYELEEAYSQAVASLRHDRGDKSFATQASVKSEFRKTVSKKDRKLIFNLTKSNDYRTILEA